MKHHDLYGYVASSSNLTYSFTEESKANKTVLIKLNLLSVIHLLPTFICVQFMNLYVCDMLLHHEYSVTLRQLQSGTYPNTLN